MDTLALMLTLAPYVGDAGDRERAELYRPVAVAIDRVARNDEERVALVVDAWFESRLARYVLEGRCADGPRGARCDPDRNGVARARGPWQVWRYCKVEGLVGEATCVVQQMRMGLARCASWEGAFSALHGPGCGWGGAPRRVQLMRKLLAYSRS